MKYDVTVVTTLFNYEGYIEDCIKSFLNQKLNGLSAEMVIVDDASTDKSHEKVKPYLDRVNYIRLHKNMGYSYAKNVGIKTSRSDVLVMLDADDMLTSTSLFDRYQRIIDNFDFVHGPVLDLRGDKLVRSKLWEKWIKSKKDSPCYKFVHAQSVMLKKSIHKDIGLYDEGLRSKSDREMWARIFNRPNQFRVGWVDTDVAIYRNHSKQMHKSKEKLRINDRLQKEVLKKIDRRSTDLSDVKFS